MFDVAEVAEKYITSTLRTTHLYDILELAYTNNVDIHTGATRSFTPRRTDMTDLTPPTQPKVTVHRTAEPDPLDEQPPTHTRVSGARVARLLRLPPAVVAQARRRPAAHRLPRLHRLPHQAVVATRTRPPRPKGPTMTLYGYSVITVYCDEPGCTAKLVTTSITTAGARGDASRADWAVSQIYSLKPSSDPERGYLCPDHNPWRKPAPKPQDGPDLFNEGARP